MGRNRGQRGAWIEDFPARFSTGWVEFCESRNTEAGPDSVARRQTKLRAATEMDSPD
jgi:hypothetical protein